MSAAKHDMRTVMGHFATGVSVVSTRRSDGSPVGTTVNAVTSVSLEPPLLLVCLAHDSETLAAVKSSLQFAVSVLAESQQEHSDRFAAKGAHAQAQEVEFSEHDPGLPCLPDALATLTCRVSAMHSAGDHMIVIGEALSMTRAADDVAPLLFFRGSYSRLERAPFAEHERPAALSGPAERKRGAQPRRVAQPQRPAGLRRIATLERIG